MNIRTLCLGILNFGDATGYEIKKLSAEGRFSYYIDASFGAIYPALTRLHEAGLISLREEQQEGKPTRKVYSITEEGRQEFIANLGVDPAPDKFKSQFLFLMMCAEYLTQDQIKKIIDDRISHLKCECHHLDEVRECCDHAGSQFVIGYGEAICQAALKYMEDNREFAEQLSRDSLKIEAAE
jgi:DNA-binding PadR family transcriptional regulator